MQQTGDERQVIQSQEEPPVKSNAHLSTSGENRSMILLQQPNMVPMNASASGTGVLNTGIESSQSYTSGSNTSHSYTPGSNTSHSYTPGSNTSHSYTPGSDTTGSLSTSVNDYVIPGTSMLQSGNSFVHVPVMAQQETAETEIDDSIDEPVRDKDELREQDRFLPIANVARIMKKAIPETGKIAKDAKECVQECVSEFISFITSELIKRASERCQQEKRKTINGEDILFAMTTLGFDNYVEPLKMYLTKYRETMKGEKVVGVSEYHTVEDASNNGMQHTVQYQVGNTLHPSMVSSDGTFAYTQAQLSQGMQFST